MLLIPCCEQVQNSTRPLNTVQRFDPSRTGPLGDRMLADVRGRVEAAQNAVASILGGVNDNSRDALVSSLNTGAFQGTLHNVLTDIIAGSQWDKSQWRKWAKAGYDQGNNRSYVDVSTLRKGVVPTLAEVVSNRRKKVGLRPIPLDYAENQVSNLLTINAPLDPLTLEAIDFISNSIYTGLTGVTSAIEAVIITTLTNGLANGDSIASIISALQTAVPSFSANRCDVLVRTEIMKAYAEGQLNMLEDLGVTELGVQVEWSTARDGRVCPLCAPMNGQVFAISAAHGLIPMHPRCRCAWIPAGFPIFSTAPATKAKRVAASSKRAVARVRV